MRMSTRQLREIIRESILLELDMGMMPGRGVSVGTGAEMHRLLDNIDPIEIVSENWEDLSEACIEAIVSSGINQDANIFFEGALEGDDARCGDVYQA